MSWKLRVVVTVGIGLAAVFFIQDLVVEHETWLREQWRRTAGEPHLAVVSDDSRLLVEVWLSELERSGVGRALGITSGSLLRGAAALWAPGLLERGWGLVLRQLGQAEVMVLAAGADGAQSIVDLSGAGSAVLQVTSYVRFDVERLVGSLRGIQVKGENVRVVGYDAGELRGYRLFLEGRGLYLLPSPDAKALFAGFDEAAVHGAVDRYEVGRGSAVRQGLRARDYRSQVVVSSEFSPFLRGLLGEYERSMVNALAVEDADKREQVVDLVGGLFRMRGVRAEVRVTRDVWVDMTLLTDSEAGAQQLAGMARTLGRPWVRSVGGRVLEGQRLIAVEGESVRVRFIVPAPVVEGALAEMVAEAK